MRYGTAIGIGISHIFGEIDTGGGPPSASRILLAGGNPNDALLQANASDYVLQAV